MEEKGTPALVTGATGFLGARIAADLVERGWQVRVLTRRTSDLGRLEGLGVQVVHGDLTDPGSLRRAVEGVRAVFHSAGRVSDWGAREEFFRTNVEGTRALLAAAAQAGVERFIHVSSLTVLGLPRTRVLVTESTPYASDPPDAYTQSKIAAEKLVREAHGRGGMATVVVRPGAIWGAGDRLIMARVVDLLRRGAMVYIDGGRNVLALSHVRNLSHACILAAVAPAAGGRIYHVTDDEPITGREAIDALAAATGYPPPRVSVPFFVVHAAARAMETVARALRRPSPPPLSSYGVRLVACDCRYDTGAARRDMGYAPLVDFRAGMAEWAAARRHAGPAATSAS